MLFPTDVLIEVLNKAAIRKEKLKIYNTRNRYTNEPVVTRNMKRSEAADVIYQSSRHIIFVRSDA